MIAYRLSFDGGLRVSGDVFPRSDTLSAALTASLATLGEDVSALAAAPDFAVSSAFPFLSTPEGPIYFLPRPHGSRLDEALPADARAASRRVAFLSPGIFSWALGADAAAALHVSQGGAVLCDRSVPALLWAERDTARRMVDRLGGRAVGAPVLGREVTFTEGAGLYFLARFADRRARARLEAALRLLGDEGLGRSSPFRIAVDEGFAAPACGAGAWVLLSLYLPTDAEAEAGVLRAARYALVSRDGVTAAGALRRSVRMIGEGARLGDVGGAPVGRAVRVLAAGERPGQGHDVFRAGTAVCIPGPPPGVAT